MLPGPPDTDEEEDPNNLYTLILDDWESLLMEFNKLFVPKRLDIVTHDKGVQVKIQTLDKKLSTLKNVISKKKRTGPRKATPVISLDDDDPIKEEFEQLFTREDSTDSESRVEKERLFKKLERVESK